MAIYHHSVSVIGRSKGRSAVAAAAYRSGEKIEDIRTGIIHDYTKKTGVDYSEIITPELSAIDTSWLTDRAKLWNRVEAAEKRYDAQLCREVTLAIPIELSRDNQIQLVRDYVQANYVAEGMVADVNLHNLDSNNPHAHVLLTMRSLIVTDDGHVEFGNKNRKWNTDAKWWDAKDLLIEQRQNWETVANQYLADNGYDRIRIDCRSLEAQGVDRIPQIHLGFHAASMRSKGVSTRIGDEYDRINLANAQLKSWEEEIDSDKLAIVDLDNQCDSLRSQINIWEIRIERAAAEAARMREEVDRNSRPLTSEDAWRIIGDDRAKRVAKWCRQNLIIPDGQSEFSPDLQSITAQMSAVNIDSRSIAYVFTDMARQRNPLTIVCCKTSGTIQSITGLLTGAIVRTIENIDDLAIKDWFRSLRNTDKTDKVTEPNTDLPDRVSSPEVAAPKTDISAQVSIPDIVKTKTVTPQPQVSIPDIVKTKTLSPTEQVSSPAIVKTKTAKTQKGMGGI